MNKLLIIISVLLFVFTMLTTPSSAKDYETTHKLNDGEVVSSDIMNEIFSRIENVSQVIKSSDMAGSWNVLQTTCSGGGPGNCNDQSLFEGFEENSDGFTRSRTDTMMFADNDGEFSYFQSTYDAFTCSHCSSYDIDTKSGIYSFIDGVALFKSGTNLGMYNIRKISPTRYILHQLNSGSHSFNIIRLDKNTLPPKPATKLSQSVSETTVTLSWVDSSDDETSFNVQRIKRGQAPEIIVELPPETTTFSETLSESGVYLYRIIASNDNGDSVGSNVVKTVIYTQQHPAVPADLQATVDGRTVTLVWTDTSQDENNFIVYRAFDNNGYQQVGQIEENIEGYEDMITSTGSYKYVVFSINDTGKSLPSKPVSIIITSLD